MPTPEKKPQGIETTDDTKKDLNTLMEDVKGSIQEFTKNPENVKGALAALSIATLAFMFRPEEKEKFEEDTRKEMEDLRKSGNLTDKEVADMKAYYEKVDNNSDPEVTIEEPPVISSSKMRAVNIDAINRKNRKILKDKGITLDKSIYEIGSYKVLKPEHLKDFNTFKDRVCNVFQPELKDNPEKQIENTARALSYCAIGVYQILPAFHFKKLGLSISGEEGLKNMYEFILSKEQQTELNLKILTISARSLDGNIEAIAANYYSGKGKEYLKYVKSGSEEKPEWITKRQGKYRSIEFYATRVRKYFKNYYGKDVARVNPNDRSQMIALQRAIQRKETGGGGRKKKKSSIDTAVA